MMRLLAAAVLLCASATVLAQLRTVPAHAKRGELRHLQDMIVQIDQQQARLSPGAQIRDIHNRLMLPAAIPPGSIVKYRTDAQGMVSEVWILTPQEAAQSAPPKLVLPPGK
jgi:hypothetical protein